MHACGSMLATMRYPYNVFDFTLNRGRDGPKYFLKDYRQVLLADAYGGYNGVVAGNEITRAGCWAHMKKKDDRCGEGRSRDRAGSGRVGARLYAVERQARDASVAERLNCAGSNRRRCWPAAREASRLEGAVAAQASHGRGGELCPGPVGGTERLLLRWRGAHRQQRLGTGDEARRAQSKNCLFVGNPRGGRTAAILASLTSTCRRHDIDPQLYLTQLLTNLRTSRKSELPDWLPDQWKRLQKARKPSKHLYFTYRSPYSLTSTLDRITSLPQRASEAHPFIHSMPAASICCRFNTNCRKGKYILCQS